MSPIKEMNEQLTEVCNSICSLQTLSIEAKGEILDKITEVRDELAKHYECLDSPAFTKPWDLRSKVRIKL